MNSEVPLNYRFAVNSPEDTHYVRVLNDLMESLPNPMGMNCVQGSAPYSCQFQARSFNNIGLMECRLDSTTGSNSLFTCERENSHISRNNNFEFHVVFWVGGENSLNTGGISHTMQAGDFTVMNVDTPFSIQAVNRGHGCTLTLPASWDRIGDTRLENVFGNIYQGRERRHNNLITYARHLLSHPNAFLHPNASEKLYDVIALSLNHRAKSEHRAGLLALIRNHIDIHCTNPDLDPATVAAAFNISIRYLYMLFADSDTSFAEYLIEQRLAQAQRILADPRYHPLTILSIAFDSGFRDINHFGRRFRARYGITPGEYRRIALAA